MQVNTLLKPTWIIPIVPEGVVLTKHVIAIADGKIAAIVPESEASQFEAKEVVELPGEIVMPGFVNLHSHAAMNLLRGVGPDLSLMDWLQKKVWPLEGRLMSPEFVYEGSRLAGEEMVQSGVTCTNDHYFFPVDAAAGLRESGMKCAVSAFLIGFPSAWAKTDDEYLKKAGEVIEHFRGDPMVHVTVSPHAPYTVSDDAMKKLAALSERNNLPIHIHVQETESEVSNSLKQYGMRPIERLKKLGIVNERLISVHSVHLSDSDIDTLAKAGRASATAQAPTSNWQAVLLLLLKSWMPESISASALTEWRATTNSICLVRHVSPPSSPKLLPKTPRRPRYTKCCTPRPWEAPKPWDGTGKSALWKQENPPISSAVSSRKLPVFRYLNLRLSCFTVQVGKVSPTSGSTVSLL